MSFRYTLILLGVLVIAIAGFGLAQRAAPPQPSGPPVTPTPVLVSLGSTDVTDLDVKIGSQEADFTKTNGQWTLTKPPDSSLLDQTKIDALANELATLHGSRVVTSGGTDLSQFGLNNPQITVTLSGADNKKQTVLVGDASLDGSQYYAMTQGGSDVELVSGGLVTTMNALVKNPPKVTPTASTAASAPAAASPAASS